MSKVSLNLSLAPHVREALRAQAAAAGLNVSAYVTSLVAREEQACDVRRRAREGVPRHLAEALSKGARQEVHWCDASHNVASVRHRPSRVWALPGVKRYRPTLPIMPVHGRNAWSLDVGHDWSMRGPDGCLRYSPGGEDHKGGWLLCEWDAEEES